MHFVSNYECKIYIIFLIQVSKIQNYCFLLRSKKMCVKTVQIKKEKKLKVQIQKRKFF